MDGYQINMALTFGHDKTKEGANYVKFEHLCGVSLKTILVVYNNLKMLVGEMSVYYNENIILVLYQYL